jgi:hypothetical protein
MNGRLLYYFSYIMISPLKIEQKIQIIHNTNTIHWMKENDFYGEKKSTKWILLNYANKILRDETLIWSIRFEIQIMWITKLMESN